jgi:hypothetical protein
MSDTPTTNWCTLNPLDKNSSQSPKDGNLYFDGSVATGGLDVIAGTMRVTSGKYYWESTITNVGSIAVTGVGVTKIQSVGRSVSGGLGGVSGECAYLPSGNKNVDGTNSAYGASFTTGDVIGVALDCDAGTVTFYKNNTSQGAITYAVGGGLSPAVGQVQGYGAIQILNFGQREFAYPPGTASATDYFNCVTYTGNGSTQSITGVGFQPDFVWIKKRDTDGNHMLTDVVRGANTELNSNTTAAETANTNALTSFNTDGFSVGADGAVNINNEGLVAWCWKAGGTASALNTGTINASVSANQDAGFSIVTYTGTGSAATVGHGLGVAPAMVIIKSRTTSDFWVVGQTSLGFTTDNYLRLNAASAKEAGGGVAWNNTAPTSTVVHIGTSSVLNGNGNNYVAYCFAEKTGISKFGSFTGNGSSTGPFVECGFKPRLVIVKRTDAASNWFMYDTIRGTNNKLYADSVQEDNGEDGGSTTSNTILSLSTGFQMTSGNGSNTNGGTYIFMAWAENFSADADFKSLNTANLPAPTIKKGSSYMDVVTYTGNGTSQSISSLDFSPDLVWLKCRSIAYNHRLVDSVQGVGSTLSSNLQSAAVNSSSEFTSLDSNGFSITQGAGYEFNNNAVPYVAWAWDASGTGSSNTDGSITSTVSANPSAGFSIVTWNGSTANGTVGHSLGVAPNLIIFKRRNATTSWPVYHSAISPSNVVYLNEDAAQASSGNSFGSTPTAPTSTVFSVGDKGDTNYGDMLAYCFAEVEGYSKFGSFVGNGSADGPFVFCGFRPAYVWLKGSTFASNWNTYDSARSEYNAADDLLRLNSAAAEVSDYSPAAIDLLSNGFKIRTSSGDWNSSGQTFVFCAFAENPFGGSGVSPATAR